MKPFTSWDVRFGAPGTLQGGNRAVEFLAGPDIPLLDLASELLGALSAPLVVRCKAVSAKFAASVLAPSESSRKTGIISGGIQSIASENTRCHELSFFVESADEFWVKWVESQSSTLGSKIPGCARSSVG